MSGFSANIPESELFASGSSGINFDKYQEIPVNVKGSDVPPVMETFDDAKVSDLVRQNIQRSGYTKPTPVQKYSIPILLAGRDLMSCAQTGSGKTAAFLVPMIDKFLSRGVEKLPQLSYLNNRRCQRPVGLILAPTRELAMQIYKESCKFSHATRLTAALLYGGRENYREQISRLQHGCNLLIATPGRLIDVVQQGYLDLSEVRFFVLDEADRMLDMGFEPQIRQIDSLGLRPKDKRTTAMFSATFPSEIQALARDFLRPDYIFITVGRVGSTTENIKQDVLWVEEHEKRNKLFEILQQSRNGLVLIFVETKRGASDLAYHLIHLGARAVSIHGDLNQFERERNLSFFKNGSYPIMVATAVAARGLDIPDVRHVINFDIPTCIDEYVHRIGRTGRAGNLGAATSFFNDKNTSLAHGIHNILVEAKQEVPTWLIQIASGPVMKRAGSGRGGRFGPRNFSSPAGFNSGSGGFGGSGGGQGFGGSNGGFSGRAAPMTFTRGPSSYQPTVGGPSSFQPMNRHRDSCSGFGNSFGLRSAEQPPRQQQFSGFARSSGGQWGN
ncbi:unnamed protein product, partial [Mesorhabditis belari]|uniref:RNA helicase n=1 Tax=Mesorhabditis belari TaxID=2138241 RepID=A0AAF3F1Q1_9BILA